jgi:putative endonuclease
MLFFIYILKSDSLNKYYVGFAEDLHHRLIAHNRGKVRDTQNGIPWKLVYMEKFNSHPINLILQLNHVN